MTIGHSSLAIVDFEHLYQAHVRFVWRTLRQLGVRRPDIADSVQDVFVVVHRRLPEFAGRSKMSTWLYGICLRTAADRRRAMRRAGKWTRVDTAVDGLAHIDESWSGSQERHVLHMQRQKLLEAVLDVLPDDQREVFVLSEMEMLPGPEIAELLSINEGTMRSRLRLARQRIHEAIAEYETQAEAK